MKNKSKMGIFFKSLWRKISKIKERLVYLVKDANPKLIPLFTGLLNKYEKNKRTKDKLNNSVPFKRPYNKTYGFNIRA